LTNDIKLKGISMHEFSVVENLIKILKKVIKENNAKKVLKVNLKINPFSCLDQENLNFIFSSIVKNNDFLENTKIIIKRGKDPLSREYIVENVEIEI